jgi:hypothetical protein
MAEKPTIKSVVSDLNERLATAEVEESDLAGGVRAVVEEEEVGKTFGLLRRSGYEFSSKRGPDGNLVVNIEARERKLGDLFA